MRILLWILCCISCCVVSCRDVTHDNADTVNDFTLPSASPWLDPAVQLSMAVRLTTRSGIDLRKALFAPNGSAAKRLALLQLRDYSREPEGEPDPQLLYLIDLDTEGLLKVEGVPGFVFGIYPAVAGDGWFAGSISSAEEEAWNAGDLTLASISPDASIETWGTQSRLWPLGVLSGQGIAALPIDKLVVEGGLPVATLNWQAQIQQLDPGSQMARLLEGPWIQLGQEGLAAGLTLEFDPALPAQARLHYFAAPHAETNDSREWTSSYYSVNGSSNWMPPLAAVNDEIFAAIVFQPDCNGRGLNGAGGIFRLLALNAVTGAADLVEDHLPADLSIAADQGVVFYTRRAWAGEGMRWETWASSPDGLRKHLLYSTADALYLAVEDASGGRRLLLNRQYMSVQDGKPELHSELIEVSLDPLEEANQASDVEPLAAPSATAQDVHSKDSGSTDFFEPLGDEAAPPERGGDGPPPIAIPD